MRRANSIYHNPAPDYVSSLFWILKSFGRTKKDVCQRLGVNYRTMGDYTNPTHPAKIPYCVQFALESEVEWEQERQEAKAA